MVKKEIWFVYDGLCPICKLGARNYVLELQNLHTLITLDARENSDHWLLAEIQSIGLDLDQGMVIWDGQCIYHADQALHFMAFSARNNWLFNLITKRLWKRKVITKWMYPAMRTIRNLLLKIKGVPPLSRKAVLSGSVFARAFGQDWDKLPSVFKKHYLHPEVELKPNVVGGYLNLRCKMGLKVFFKLFKFLGTVPLVCQENVPVSVRFSGDGAMFMIKRQFNFVGRSPFVFNSKMSSNPSGDILEKMKFGIHWRSHFQLKGDKIVIHHKAFEWRLGGLVMRLPLEFLLGKAVAEEWAIDENSFGMFVRLEHKYWGRIYEYEGVFSYA